MTNFILGKIMFDVYNLNESINDKNLFKAVFMAGGPGSGKSFVANTMFGFGKDRISFSGAMLVNTDIFFELGLRKADLPMVVNPDNRSVYDRQMEIRDKATRLTKTKQGFWINSMLPLVIDGTGKDFEKIRNQADVLKAFGYDVYMVFVNTSLDTAQKRNAERERSLSPKMIEQMWNMVQFNMGKFQEYFTPSNFRVIDNNETYEEGSEEERDFSRNLFRIGRNILTSPLQNRIGIANIKYLRDNGGKYLSDLVPDYGLEKRERRRLDKDKRIR